MVKALTAEDCGKIEDLSSKLSELMDELEKAKEEEQRAHNAYDLARKAANEVETHFNSIRNQMTELLKGE